MLIKASQYFEKTSFSINFTSVFINTCVDSQMNLHKDNFLMSFYKHLILLYNTSIMPTFTEEEKRYVVLSLRNSSSTGFTTSDATFVIEDRKRHKRAVRIEKSIFPSTSFGSLSATGGAFSKAVYSFDKLTISKDQVLKIYIYEESGQRNLEMTISAKEINR